MLSAIGAVIMDVVGGTWQILDWIVVLANMRGKLKTANKPPNMSELLSCLQLKHWLEYSVC